VRGRRPDGGPDAETRRRKTPEEVVEAIGEGWVVRSVRPHGETGARWMVSVKPEDGLGRRGVRFIVAGDPGPMGLVEGVAWDDRLAAAAVGGMHADRARRAAVNALNRRAMPSGKLAEALRRKGSPPDVVAGVVAEMQRLGVLDDRAYARGVARSLVSRGGAGRRLVEMKLSQRGVPRDLAREVAAEACAERDPADDAMALARKKLRTLERFDDATRRRRLYGALARRGFDADVCRTAVDRALAGGDDDA
jgi:regulatory protein